VHFLWWNASTKEPTAVNPFLNRRPLNLFMAINQSFYKLARSFLVTPIRSACNAWRPNETQNRFQWMLFAVHAWQTQTIASWRIRGLCRFYDVSEAHWHTLFLMSSRILVSSISTLARRRRQKRMSVIKLTIESFRLITHNNFYETLLIERSVLSSRLARRKDTFDM